MTRNSWWMCPSEYQHLLGPRQRIRQCRGHLAQWHQYYAPHPNTSMPCISFSMQLLRAIWLSTLPYYKYLQQWWVSSSMVHPFSVAHLPQHLAIRAPNPSYNCVKRLWLWRRRAVIPILSMRDFSHRWPPNIRPILTMANSMNSLQSPYQRQWNLRLRENEPSIVPIHDAMDLFPIRGGYYSWPHQILQSTWSHSRHMGQYWQQTRDNCMTPNSGILSRCQ